MDSKHVEPSMTVTTGNSGSDAEHSSDETWSNGSSELTRSARDRERSNRVWSRRVDVFLNGNL
jgi:hypothetical protein